MTRGELAFGGGVAGGGTVSLRRKTVNVRRMMGISGSVSVLSCRLAALVARGLDMHASMHAGHRGGDLASVVVLIGSVQYV